VSAPSIAAGLESEIASFREHLATADVCQKSVHSHYVRGARELLAFLAARGKPLEVFTPEDLAAFEKSLRTEGQAKRSGVHGVIAGARAYLRMKAYRGELACDEALFFSLSPRLTQGTRAPAAWGDSPHALLLRDVQGFDDVLLSQGLGRVKRRGYVRAAVKLLFFLKRSGKDVTQITLDDWQGFAVEVRRQHTRISSERILTGARLYLRLQCEKGQLQKEQLPPTFHVKALARLSLAGRRELVSFRERLRASCTVNTLTPYVWGVRELLLFIERKGKATADLTAADFVAFSDELRMRVGSDIAASRLTGVLCGARHYLRERALQDSPQDETLLPLIAPAHLDKLHALIAARGKGEARLVHEVDDFHHERRKLGYGPSATARHGARRLLIFLAARGRKLAELVPEDFEAFKRDVLSHERPGQAEALVVGAAAYLRIKARQGVIGEDQVPTRVLGPRPMPALPEALLSCLSVLHEGLQASDFAVTTKATYRRALRDFLVWLHEEHGIVSPGEVTRDTITAYRLYLQVRPSVKGTPYAIYTQEGLLCGLRFFFSWLVKTGRMLSDPTLHLPHLRRPKHLPRAMKAAELVRFIARQPKTVLGLRDRALIELLYGTGMRRGEVARLRLDDMDLEERVILIREGKGQKDRVVPLGRKAKAVLLDYIEHSRTKLLRGDDARALFVGHGGRPLSASQVTHRLIHLGRLCGIKLTPHMLRHSCATHLLRGRADIRHIQRLLGHKSLNTTERYTQVEVQDLRAVIQRCHPRERRPKERGEGQ
jgi:integrase/recombinase XerD